ncbi:MAG: hypothetical protein K9H62_13985 [Bacteroidales bacterium]|nr:hypothetical protein [Bacteroidales bacterium]
MKTKYFIPILILAVIISCDDIFEADISNAELVVNYPPAQYSTPQLSLSFDWEAVEDAIEYEIRITTMENGLYTIIYMDSVVSETSLLISFYPDTFDWSIRAMNYSSETQYASGKLIITDDESLDGQNVLLFLPVDNFYTNETEICFRWDTLEQADYYTIDIRKDSWGGDFFINPQIVFTDTIVNTLDEGKYVWGVQARNNSSNTLYTTRTLYVDTTVPGIPTITYPLDSATVSYLGISIPLQWQHASDSGSPLSDSIFIASDSTFESIILHELTSSTTFYFNPEAQTEIFWQLKSVDKAGNVGAACEIHTFSVNY